MLANIENFSVSKILKSTGGTLIFGSEDEGVLSISTDSREIGDKCLYIPIKGEKFDGHTFLEGALKNGAEGYLTQNDDIVKGY